MDLAKICFDLDICMKSYNHVYYFMGKIIRLHVFIISLYLFMFIFFNCFYFWGLHSLKIINCSNKSVFHKNQ